ncbi:GNAT family N-acetyltransferase [Streptomyces sp. NPDC048636]|uniref:GNAT family N-acetyltransferase n=1 Tax=Streptomyces sp. NPDC048636 TaxID=3155762 RepID=UPI003413A421
MDSSGRDFDQGAPSALTVHSYSDPAEISREWWESLSHPSAYLGFDWLRARSATIHGKPRFIGVAGPDGEALLGAPAFLTDSSSHPAYDPARFLGMADLPEEDIAAEPGAAAALARLRGRLEDRASGPSVVSGSPGRMGGVSYAGALSPEGRRDALGLAAAELERQAEAASAELVCWVYVIEDADGTADTVLRERGYTRVSVGADCHLPITWDSFDGYLRGFGAKRRRSIQREVRAFTEAGVTVERHGVEALDRELAGLELQWRRKYDRKADLEATVSDYRELREHVGDAMTVFVARRQGRALGFVTFIEDGPVWWARFPGFDYSAGSEDIYLYFNLVFYHPIRVAIGEGISSISYSMGSYETKCSRGCSPRHLLAYVRTADDASLAADLEVADRVQHRRFDRIARAHTHRGRG